MFSRKVFISISLVFALPLFTNAFIDHPYVVDEKPQVLFGDSIEVDGHYGLENIYIGHNDFSHNTGFGVNDSGNAMSIMNAKNVSCYTKIKSGLRNVRLGARKIKAAI